MNTTTLSPRRQSRSVAARPSPTNSQLCLKVVNDATRATLTGRQNSIACRILADALDDEGDGWMAAIWREVASFLDRYAEKMHRFSGGKPSTLFYAFSPWQDTINICRYRPVTGKVNRYESRIIAEVFTRTGQVTGVGLWNHSTQERDYLPSLADLAEKFSLPEL